MDLAINNLQRLICHKTQPNNQPTFNFSTEKSTENGLDKTTKMKLSVFFFYSNFAQSGYRKTMMEICAEFNSFDISQNLYKQE